MRRVIRESPVESPMHRACAAILLVTACAGSPVGPSLEWGRALQVASDRWAAAAITDYTYTYSRGCFCPPLALRVTVREGAVIAIHDLVADTAHVAPFADWTVEALHARIAEGLVQLPAAFSAEYDPATGVPRSASFDPIANAVDDEWGFSVTGFTNAR